MQPSIPSRYPEFVSDQVLTASNLNELFGYLDEQVRMTRTNLIGIGVVCGLEVRVNAGGTIVTITKGTGVTSSGYLATLPTTAYSHYNDEFSPEQERYYDRFVDPATKLQRFPLFELAEAGSPLAKKPLTAAFLQDKVVLLFVELLEESNKNCNPDSCDDKGKMVTVTIRPLLVSASDAEALLANDDASGFSKAGLKCGDWPELRLPRYNVPATTLPTTAHILKSFLDIIKDPLIPNIEQTLTAVHAAMKPLLDGPLASNPFAGLRQKLDFLFTADLGTQRLMHVQYFTDAISDILLAYEELRTVCNRAMAVCCPDESLFPRHLLLGSITAQNRSWRQNFIPSPAVCCGSNVVEELRSLLQRLARMIASLNIPVALQALKRGGVPVRITPSLLGDQALSARAIPYYYNVTQGAPPLYETWDYRKSSQGKAKTNLSYHAAQYNSSDAWVRTPLLYDIERFNFFRIEGHIGMQWQTALQNIKDIRDTHRLPFDVIALNGDFRSLVAFLRAASVDLRKALGDNPDQWKKLLCLFSDIETAYDLHTAELRCALCGVMRFLYDFNNKGVAAQPNSTAKASALLLTCSPGHAVQSDTYGAAFEAWYPTLPKDSTGIAPEFFSTNSLAAGISVASPLILMYWLEKIHEAMPAGLIDLNVSKVQLSIESAAAVAAQLRQALQNTTGETPQITELKRHLETVLRICSIAVFRELFRNMLARFKKHLESQSFALYSAMHSGIQHKAGVPVGGTFILVYHDSTVAATRLPGREIAADRVTAATATTTAAASPNTASTSVAAVPENDRTKRTIASAAKATSSFTTNFAMTSDKLLDITSIKMVGEFFVNDLVANVRDEDDLTDKTLLSLVAEIPDGAVIADFFIPCTCVSDCPPMNFIVIPPKETPEPTPEVSIQMDEDDFCFASEAPITVHVSPEGGTLVSSAGGVEAGSFEFVPSKVTMGNTGTQSVTLTYTVNNVSASLTVLVFNIPTANITFTAVPTAQNTFAFAANAAFAETLEWNFGDGTPVQTGAQTVHSFQQPGAFTVTLTLGNGPCTQTLTTTVTIQAPPQPQTQCRKLEEWHKIFTTFDASATDRTLILFKRAFTPYPDVLKLFKEIIPPLLSLPQTEQAEKLAAALPVSQLMEWLKLLQTIIVGTATVTIRHHALALLRILNGLLVFFACANKGDVHQEAVPTQQAFELMLEMMAAWANLNPALRPQDIEVVKALAKDYETELAMISAAQPAKRRYISLLKKLQGTAEGVV